MVLANPTLICTTLYFMVGRSGEFVRTKELQIRGCFTTCEDITFSALHLSCLFQVSFDLWGRHIFLLRTWAAYYKFHLTCEDITLFSYSPELPFTSFIWLVKTSHFFIYSPELPITSFIWPVRTSNFSASHLSCQHRQQRQRPRLLTMSLLWRIWSPRDLGVSEGKRA